MQYRALACDYDGTLATDSRVDGDTIASLQQWKAAGRKLLLVTGRELPELKTVLPELHLFDYVVAENGGLLYLPATQELRAVAMSPPPEFVAELTARGVGPISVGHTIVATWQPHENTVLDTIKDMGLELQVIFNKGAVMILPTGVNKATGLAAALKSLELSRHSVVAVGDAENDHAFLSFSRIGVAVDNALPALKQRAEFVTEADHGRGVQQLIARLLANDLAEIPAPERHRISLGAGNASWLPGEEHLVLSGDDGELPQFEDQLVEKLGAKGYQHLRFACTTTQPAATATTAVGAVNEVTVGTAAQLPTADEVLQLLVRPDQSVRVVLCAHGPDDRRQRVSELWHQLQRFVQQRGRPHVIFLPLPGELVELKLDARQLAHGFSSVVVAQAGSSTLSALSHPYQLLSANDWRLSPTVISTT